MAEKLSGETRKTALARLTGWREVAGRDAISKKFVFKDFSEAFSRDEFRLAAAQFRRHFIDG